MPITHTDIRICEKCNRSFEWNKYEDIRYPARLPIVPVDVIPEGKTYTSGFEMNKNGTYTVTVNCPHCRTTNVFEYNDR